jgi:hypothetical protein
VLKVRRYFNDKHAQDQMNSAIMLLHASAFGIYLLSVSLVMVARTYGGITENQQFLNKTLTAAIIGDFISQLLLIAIFWDLGKPENIRRESEISSTMFAAVEVDEFDDEAELQARIWNRFQRGDRFEKGTYRVTAASILQMRATHASFISSSSQKSSKDVRLSVINDSEDL